jgi:hypothetical protein
MKNKESQSQQVAGYSLSLKLENESRTKVWKIKSICNNKKYDLNAFYFGVLHPV